MNDNRISEAMNGVSDRHIRQSDTELLTGSGNTRGIMRGIRAAFVAAACAAVFGIGLTAGAAATNGFTSSFSKVSGYDKGWKMPWVRFEAGSSEGCPEAIEDMYAPSYLPEGIDYRVHVFAADVISNDSTRFQVYYDKQIKDSVEDPFVNMGVIYFDQYVKKAFSWTFGTPEYYEAREVTINGCEAYMFVEEHYYGYSTRIIWENGDYIFHMYCFLPPEESMRVAESVRVNNDILKEASE